MFTLSEFAQFLRKPQYTTQEKKHANVFLIALKIYLWLILLTGLIGAFNSFILPALMTLPVDETFEVPPSMKNHLWVYFLVIVFLAPAIEEVIFRLSLIFKPANLALSVSTLLALIIQRFSNHLTSALSFFLLLVLGYWITRQYKLQINAFWRKNFRYIFYFLAISFGLLHITNYKYINATEYIIAPVLVLPQIIIGFILSFTRMHFKNGFLTSFVAHSFLNFIPTSILFLHFTCTS